MKIDIWVQFLTKISSKRSLSWIISLSNSKWRVPEVDFRNPTSLEFTDERVKQLFKIIDIFGVNLEYSNLNFHLPILF